MPELLRDRLCAWARSRPSVSAVYLFRADAGRRAIDASDLDVIFDMAPATSDPCAEFVATAAHLRAELHAVTGARIRNLYLGSDPFTMGKVEIFRREAG